MKTRIDVVLVISSLALIAIAGLVGIIVLSYAGKHVDSSIVGAMSGAAGALAAMLARTASTSESGGSQVPATETYRSPPAVPGPTAMQRIRAKLGIAGVAFAGLTLLAIALLGCPPAAQSADAMARDSARGAVYVLVEGVELADVVCSNIAARAKGSEDAEKLREGIKLAGKCAKAKDVALAAAKAAQLAIKAWGAGAEGALACAGAQALESLNLVRDAAARAGERLPDALEDAISRAAFLARFIPAGSACPVASTAVAS